MPSSTKIDLTLGATGTQYTAPANGYYQLGVLNGTAIQFYNNSKGSFWNAVYGTGGAISNSIACQTGDTIQCYYEYTQFRWFRFYYAVGAVPTNT